MFCHSLCRLAISLPETIYVSSCALCIFCTSKDPKPQYSVCLLLISVLSSRLRTWSQCLLAAVAVKVFVRLQATGSVVLRIACDTEEACTELQAAAQSTVAQTPRGRPVARALELPLDVTTTHVELLSSPTVCSIDCGEPEDMQDSSEVFVKWILVEFDIGSRLNSTRS
ncbi:hypothetical protein BDV19DRAFT_165764 [Aspergillus venezuelensis]